jgi:hypothetical protein
MNELERLKSEAAKARADQGFEAEEVETAEPERRDPEIGDDEEEEETTTIESEPEEEEEDDGQTETDEEEDTVEPQARPKGKSVFKQLNEVRTQKRESDAKANELLELIGASSIEDARSKITELRSTAPLSEEFVQAAKEMGVEDPENLKKLADLVGKQVRSSIDSELKPLKDTASSLQEWQEERAQRNEYEESMEQFNSEWAEVLPVIEQNYRPTPTQAKQAETLLSELAHSEDYHDKELDYILFKEQDKFEAILGNPRRKGMIRARGIAQPVKEEVNTNGLPKIDRDSHSSIMNARKRLQAIKTQDDFTDPDTEFI